MSVHDELTKEEAIGLYNSGWWVGLPAIDVAKFQLHQRLLCVPFDVYQHAVEKAMGRSVYTHEFAHPDGLRAELNGGESPTWQEILDLLPANKRTVVKL